MFRLTQKDKKLKCNEDEFEYRMQELYKSVYSFYDSIVNDQEVPEKSYDVVSLFI